MMHTHSLRFLSPLLLSPPSPHFLPGKPTTRILFLPNLPLTISIKSLPTLSRTSPKATQHHQHEEEAILQFVADSDENTIACFRTFENDLARLSLVGGVLSEQALTAAAADGGRAATEHIDSGFPSMVVETVFPGPGDEHATVSTRLFLSARKVKEKARKLKSSLNEDILSSTTSQNILAMTFRQVVLQKLWKFELTVFRPGAERNMEDLENPREVPATFFIRANDEWVISVLAEAVCVAALQSTERLFFDDFFGKNSSGYFRWFRKPKRIVSKDLSVIIEKLFEDEMVENAKSLLQSFSSNKESSKGIKIKQKYNWWTPSMCSELEKIGGPEFSAWTSEYVPAYRLQIDADKVKDHLKFEGGIMSADNKWEVLLTHSQMVGLAEILDMYFEDMYSLPTKELSCGTVANFANLSSKKRNSYLMNILSIAFASGIFLITISALGRFCFPHLRKGQTYALESRSVPSAETKYAINESLDATKLQEICISVVKKIKDAFSWPDDIRTDTNIGAWTGEIPNYFRMKGEAELGMEENPTDSAPSQKIDADMKSSAQDIASYQVVLSVDGKIVGFQPTSRVGVNHWATNPLAKELYNRKRLSPGFIEPSLKIQPPNKVVVIELLMSVNVDSHFALARPFQ